MFYGLICKSKDSVKSRNFRSKLYILGVRLGLALHGCFASCYIPFKLMSLHYLSPCHAFLSAWPFASLSAYSSPIFVSVCFYVIHYLPISLCPVQLSRVCLSVCLFDCFSVCTTVYITPSCCLPISRLPPSVYCIRLLPSPPACLPACLPGSVALFYHTRMLLHCAWTCVALSGNRWF